MMKSVLFVHEIPIKEIKANLIQTLNMCFAFSKKGIKTKLLILTSISVEESTNAVNNIIPSYINYFEINFIPYQASRNYFSSGERFSSLKEHIDLSSEFIFTRSPLVSLYVTKLGKNLIYESHNAYFTKNKILNFYYNYKFKRLIKKTSFKLFLSISDNLKSFWLNHKMPEAKLLALHDGTSVNDKIIIPKESYPFIDNTRLKVTYTGSLYKDRGLDRLLNLARDFEKLDFLVIGGPNKNANKFKQIAKTKRLSNIIFHGYVNRKEIPYYLSKSDILLALWSRSVPTIEYCSPLKVFEYLNSNKLIIADGFTTIKEVLIHNENAVLCEPDNYKSLKNEIEIVLNDLSKLELGKNNDQLIRNKYSWEKRVEFIIEKLEKDA